MAEYQSLQNAPEYADVIDKLTKRYALQKSQAEASAKGEAQRRGLVNPTGTSDIEAALRGNAVGAVANAEGDAIGNVLMQAAQQGNANQQAALNRQFQTSERLGGQGWQTGERIGGQQFQTGENAAQRGWQTGERTGAQDWQAQQNLGDKTFQEKMMDKQRGWNLDDQPSGWQSFLQGASGGVGQGVGSFIGSGIKKLFSDIRLKQNIKPVATLYEFEYKDNEDTKRLGINDGKKHYGLMAQEIEKLIPGAVGEDRGYKYIDYSKILEA